MAFDSAADRLAIMDFGGPTEPAMPLPTGTIAAPARHHLLWLYQTAGEVVVGDITARVMHQYRQRRV